MEEKYESKPFDITLVSAILSSSIEPSMKIKLITPMRGSSSNDLVMMMMMKMTIKRVSVEGGGYVAVIR